MKKAQLMSQPFYYIFVVIVIALIFVFGFNIINNLIKAQEQSKFIQFKTDFNNIVDNVYSKSPGTKISSSLLLPKDAKKVCFNQFPDYTRVSSDSIYSISFTNNNLVHNKDNPYCINVKAQEVTFTLENKVISDKSIVEIS